MENRTTVLDQKQQEMINKAEHVEPASTEQVGETIRRGPSSVGPATPRRITDVVRSNNATRDALTDREFVAGIDSIIKSDLMIGQQSEQNTVTLGGFYRKALSFVKGVKDGETNDDFEAILCSLCPTPLDPVTMEGQTTAHLVSVIHTHKQRLAYAVYIERDPAAVTTKSGTETLATKRIGNALAKFDAAFKAESEQFAKEQREANKLLYPSRADLPQSEQEQEASKQIAEAEAKGKALADAARKMLPRTPGQIFVALYSISYDDAARTNAWRTDLIRAFVDLRYPGEKIDKWVSDSMDKIKNTVPSTVPTDEENAA